MSVSSAPSAPTGGLTSNLWAPSGRRSSTSSPTCTRTRPLGGGARTAGGSSRSTVRRCSGGTSGRRTSAGEAATCRSTNATGASTTLAVGQRARVPPFAWCAMGEAVGRDTLPSQSYPAWVMSRSGPGCPCAFPPLPLWADVPFPLSRHVQSVLCPHAPCPRCALRVCPQARLRHFGRLVAGAASLDNRSVAFCVLGATGSCASPCVPLPVRRRWPASRRELLPGCPCA